MKLDEEEYLKVQDALEKLSSTGMKEEDISKLLQTESFTELNTLWTQFLDHLRTTNGDL